MPTEPRNYLTALAFIEATPKGRARRNRPLGHALRVVELDDKRIAVAYHETYIVTWYRDLAGVRVYDGGWRTKTTLSHIARLTGLVLSSRGPKGDGPRESFRHWLLYPDRPERTAPKLQRCRTCKGTGEKYGSCYRCAGSGTADYGSKPIPLVERERLSHYVERTSGPFATVTAELVGIEDERWPCTCKLCATGCPSWQDHHWKHAGQVIGPSGPVGTAYDSAPRKLKAILPALELVTPHPIEGQGALRVIETVIDLNDEHGWTREQVADWLETLDLDLTFPIPERIAPGVR